MTDLTDLSPPHVPSDPTEPGDPLPGGSTDPLGARAPGDPVVLADGGQDLRDLRDLRDRMDLRQLVDTYAHALDRRMAELFASLFDEGGELVLVRPADSGRAPLVLDGRDGWARALAVLEPCRVTTHFVGNHLVRLAGDGATGETYCLAHEIYPADGPDRMRVRSIRYRDTYRRANGSWLFARRELTIDWTEDRVLRSPSGP
ncbi:nuclear transport factor 2 family protein [Streptomyces europaeiscabiei]|uniref:nuclear transport factor 2 family protein n=1 Tax=Streptomyces europaeiscabiei TaxID=146819 RepID=UPI002E2CEDD8|nr:nuclear transport factor 2 family protein [Streptomyces europaeiscabiei]